MKATSIPNPVSRQRIVVNPASHPKNEGDPVMSEHTPTTEQVRGEFARDGIGASSVDPVVEPESWEAAKGAMSPSEALGPFHLYLDVSLDSTHATLAGTAQIEDITHVWVVDQCRQLRFDRWLAAEKAKWQAEALRDAVRDMRAVWREGWNFPDPLDPEVSYSVDVWLEVRANRIEKGTDR